MATATVKLGPPLLGACWNCGGVIGRVVAVVRDDMKVGWKGCDQCWPRVCAKGQQEVVAQMLRALDQDKKSSALRAV